jgi:hypothetical protein
MIGDESRRRTLSEPRALAGDRNEDGCGYYCRSCQCRARAVLDARVARRSVVRVRRPTVAVRFLMSGAMLSRHAVIVRKGAKAGSHRCKRAKWQQRDHEEKNGGFDLALHVERKLTQLIRYLAPGGALRPGAFLAPTPRKRNKSERPSCLQATRTPLPSLRLIHACMPACRAVPTPALPP